MGDPIGYLRFFFLRAGRLWDPGDLRDPRFAQARFGQRQDFPLAEGPASALGRRWQRNMRLIALATLFYLGVMVGFVSTIPMEAWVARWIAVLVLPAMVVAGVVLQFSERCPRCGLLLGLQTSLGVPSTCERCAVSFRE